MILDKEQFDTIISLLNARILDMCYMSKLDYLANEISKGECDWKVGHGEYIKEIKEKLVKNYNKLVG